MEHTLVVNERTIWKTLRTAIAVGTLCLSGVMFLPYPAAAAAQTSRTEVAAVLDVNRSEWDAANARIRAATDAGQTASLIPLAEAALGIAERRFGPNAGETLISVRWLADLNYEQGRFAAAGPFYERALKGSRDDDPLILTAAPTWNAVHRLALIYQKQGRYAQAEPLFARAVRFSERWMGAEHPETLGLTADLAFDRLSDRALAPKALDPARTLAARIRTRRDTLTYPGVVRSPANHQLGNRSRDVCEQYGLANARATRERSNDLEAFVLLADAAWARAEQDPGARLALTGEAFVALQDAIVGTAAKAVERMAVRATAARQSASLGALVRERQTLEDRSTTNADEQARSVCGAFKPTPDQNDPVAVGQQIEIEEQRIDARMRAEFPDYYSFASKSALDLAAAQRLLGPDEAMLLVVPTPFGTHVMAISRTQVEWRRSNWDRTRIATAVKRVLFDMGQDFGVDSATTARWMKEGGPGTPFDRRTAYSLYRQLIAPVDSVLAGKRDVFIATSGALTSLPFGILVTETPEGGDADPAALRATRWLADVHALSVIPSIQALGFLREAAKIPGPSSQSASFAGYGDPRLAGRAQDRGLKSGRAIRPRAAVQVGSSRSGGGVAQIALLKSMASLPGTAEELENMRAAIGAPTSSVHLQDQATERAVRTDDLSHIRILAFATHGLMAGELTGASEPGLVFTPPSQASEDDDGYLTASEVTELKLDADWVILSACNTAAGDGSEGAAGLSGLARAFFYAGARSLLVSHWPVDDAVAARLTVDAIRRRRADPFLGRTAALQQAMRAIRNDVSHDSATGTWAHPHAWAPFSLIGDGAH